MGLEFRDVEQQLLPNESWIPIQLHVRSQERIMKITVEPPHRLQQCRLNNSNTLLNNPPSPASSNFHFRRVSGGARRPLLLRLNSGVACRYASQSEVRHGHGHVSEKAMYKCIFCRKPFVWVIFQHFLERKK